MESLGKDIVFWLNQPPKVEVGAYNALSKLVSDKTYYICMHDLPEERKKLNWGSTSYGNAELIILPSVDEEKNKYLESFIRDDFIHIVCGFSGSAADVICPMLKKKKIKFCVVSEKPRILYDNLKDVIVSIGLGIKYGIIKKMQYKSSVKAILPLGQAGVQQFQKLGWSKDLLFQFMYCGEYDDIDEICQNNKGKNVIRFLYIGRFGYNHALDVMMKAFDLLVADNWTLDMAGGYGENREEVLAWINRKSNVNFIGKIDSRHVRKKMCEYDCLVVPSRLDGWNCQINEALSVFCPVITTYCSVSNELVVNSGAGISVNNLSAESFSKALSNVLEKPELIGVWRKNAKEYRECFSSETVGLYLLRILQFSYGFTADRPNCPWQKK